MADRYLLESGSPDGYLLEDGSGVLLLETGVFWDPIDGFNKNRFLTLSNSNLTSTSDNQGLWESVRANLPTAVSAFRFEVSLVTGSTPTNVSVGVENGLTDFSALNALPGSSNSNGVTLTLGGTGWVILRSGGVVQGPFGSPAAASGQIVTVVVDKAAQTVAFLVNGTQIGVNETSVSFTNWYADVSGKDGATSAGIGNFSGPFSYGTGSAYDGSVSGAITGTSSLSFSPAGTLTGTGALTGTSPLTFTPSSTIQGLAPITGSSSIIFSPSSTLTGKGALSGTSSLTFTPSATATGTGALTGASTLVFSPAGTMTASGALTGASTLTFAPVATLTGTGALSATSTLSFAPSGTLDGKGALSGASSISFSPLGTLTNGGAIIGALTGSSSISFSPAGTLSGSGALVGSTGITFAPAGTLGGIAYITGIASLTFTASATLHGEGPFNFWRQPPLVGRRINPGRSR